MEKGIDVLDSNLPGVSAQFQTIIYLIGTRVYKIEEKFKSIDK